MLTHEGHLHQNGILIRVKYLNGYNNELGMHESIKLEEFKIKVVIHF